jgi:C-terminal processing protease CtpA/Prc
MPVAVPGIFISFISPNSPAALTKQLQVGDQILAIGNQSMTNASEQLARHFLKTSSGEVTLVVAKSRVHLRTVLSEC